MCARACQVEAQLLLRLVWSLELTSSFEDDLRCCSSSPVLALQINLTTTTGPLVRLSCTSSTLPVVGIVVEIERSKGSDDFASDETDECRELLRRHRGNSRRMPAAARHLDPVDTSFEKRWNDTKSAATKWRTMTTKSKSLQHWRDATTEEFECSFFTHYPWTPLVSVSQ